MSGEIIHLLSGEYEVLAAVLLRCVLVGPGQEFRHLSRGELCLANVAEIPRQVNGLTLDKKYLIK
jgi:hypothetical protein